MSKSKRPLSDEPVISLVEAIENPPPYSAADLFEPDNENETPLEAWRSRLLTLKQQREISAKLNLTYWNFHAADKLKAKGAALEELARNQPYEFCASFNGHLGCVEEAAVAAQLLPECLREARTALSFLLDEVLNVLLRSAEEPGNGENALASCALLVEGLAPALARMEALYEREDRAEVFQKLAGTRAEFPSLITIFEKGNKQQMKYIMEGLRLGQMLPFSPDSRQGGSVAKRLAIRILMEIDEARRDEASIYEKVFKKIREIPLSEDYENEWKQVVGFHLDFYQAPIKTRRKVAEEYGCQEELRESLSSDWLNTDDFGPSTPVTKMFSSMRVTPKKKIRSDGALYSQGRRLVLEAIPTLLRE